MLKRYRTISGGALLVAAVAGLIVMGSLGSDLALASGGTDTNGDGTLDIADAVYLLNFLFNMGPELLGPSDANGDGFINIADAIYILYGLFG